MGENRSRFALRRRGLIDDALLAIAVVAFTVPMTLTGQSFSVLAVPLWGELLAGVIAAATMLVRRRTPWPAVLGTAGCALVTGQGAPMLIAAFSMTAEHRLLRWRWVAGGMAAVYALVDFANPAGDRLPYLAVIRAITLIYLPALIGTWLCRYRRLIRDLHTGVRVREEQAATQERRRIAAELHDTVTHAVTVMVLNAGIIQDTKDLNEARKLAVHIEDKGVQALTELRELLTVLRRGEIPPTAAGVEAIPALVDEVRATGLRVSLDYNVMEGALCRETSHACYRVVQEGLNNVRKHAPGSDVRVCCEIWGDIVIVSVVNSGERHGEPATVPRLVESGFGLAGLRECVMLAGGRLEAGPTPEGGFELHAWIPARFEDDS